MNRRVDRLSLAQTKIKHTDSADKLSSREKFIAVETANQ